jgi:hypothetical protein
VHRRRYGGFPCCGALIPNHPRAACGVTPSRGRRKWPGKAGSTAPWVKSPLYPTFF